MYTNYCGRMRCARAIEGFRNLPLIMFSGRFYPMNGARDGSWMVQRNVMTLRDMNMLCAQDYPLYETYEIGPQ